jgi:hypothetical protein
MGLLDLIVEEVSNAVEDAAGSVDDLLKGRIGTKRQIKTGLRGLGLGLGISLLDDD